MKFIEVLSILNNVCIGIKLLCFYRIKSSEGLIEFLDLQVSLAPTPVGWSDVILLEGVKKHRCAIIGQRFLAS